jgi:hypothetical protein
MAATNSIYGCNYFNISLQQSFYSNATILIAQSGPNVPSTSILQLCIPATVSLYGCNALTITAATVSYMSANPTFYINATVSLLLVL